MILTELTLDAAELEHGTGWSVKPEGACRGEVCVPLPGTVRAPDGTVDTQVLAKLLAMPLIDDEQHNLWALGPATVPTGHALVSAEAPELELPDLRTGELFRLSSLRGQKVMLLAWASW